MHPGISVIPSQKGGSSFATSAFTLIELLVVMAVIGIMAVVALPAIKSMRKSNSQASTNRQLLDDVSMARRMAIKDRTTVMMVFMPPVGTAAEPAGLSKAEKDIILRGQQTSYALFAFRQVGDQPGSKNPRYLQKWRSLPPGFFIPGWKFQNATAALISTNGAPGNEIRVDPFKYVSGGSLGISVPSVQSTNYLPDMPYIAFGPTGKLQEHTGSRVFVDLKQDEIIPLARGSIFLSRDVNDALTWGAADVAEREPDNSINNYNLIIIDHLTGRPRLLRPEIQ